MDKNKRDYIVRAIAANGQLRAFASTTQNLVDEARKRHKTSPIATAALGRLLTAGGIMGSMMKSEDDLLTINIRGDGALGGITVTANQNADVKGYVFNPEVMLPPKNGKLDVGGAVGHGVLQVIQDLGLKEPYASQTQLVSGEIAEDLAYYFASSEQVASVVALGVLMNKDNTVHEAGGFIIQPMPFADDEIIDRLEEKIKNCPPITTMLSEGKSPEEILDFLLGDMALEVTDKVDTRFYCNCDKHRVAKAIISIGKKDIQEIIDGGESIEVKCEFCNTTYNYSVEELEVLLEQAK
jgi:molecular chaperone Hsp33